MFSTSVLVDLIVSHGILIRIFLKRYNKLCSPLLHLLNMRCFSVKINRAGARDLEAPPNTTREALPPFPSPSPPSLPLPSPPLPLEVGSLRSRPP